MIRAAFWLVAGLGGCAALIAASAALLAAGEVLTWVAELLFGVGAAAADAGTRWARACRRRSGLDDDEPAS